MPWVVGSSLDNRLVYQDNISNIGTYVGTSSQTFTAVLPPASDIAVFQGDQVAVREHTDSIPQ